MSVLVASCSTETASTEEPTAASQTAAGIPLVHAAIPTWLAIPALGLNSQILTISAEDCPVLNPPALDHPYWVGCRAMAGTDSDGTVFIIGHAVARGGGVFDDLPKLVAGDIVRVGTPSGELTYRVTRTATYGKHGDIQNAPEMRARVPGRLFLVTCYMTAQGRTARNFVAETELIGAESR